MVNKRIQQLIQQKKNRENGKFNCLPFHDHFPRFSKIVPGFIKGSINTILSGTGVGKSKMGRFLSCIVPYELNKKYGLKFKTIYFSLEESKEEFIDNMILMLLKIHHGIDIDRLTLNSYFFDALDNNILDKIISIQEYVEDLMRYVDVVDNIYNPTGIYTYCKDKSIEWGKHYSKEKEFQIGDDTETRTIYSHYEANDDEEFVLVCVDHLGLMTPEKGASTTFDAMSRWSSDYCVKQIAKHWGWIVLNIQQTMMSSDDLNHFKANKLEPSIGDAGDNKIIMRDAKLIFTLFAPNRYELPNHKGYDIRKLKDNYRSLGIPKNRYGRSDIRVPLFFEGATGRFSEMPELDSKELNDLYKQLQK